MADVSGALRMLRETAEAAWRPCAQPERPLIRLPLATCSRAAGAAETLDALRRELARRGEPADLLIVGCPGLCFADPVVDVHLPGLPRVLYGRVTADRVPALLDAVLGDARVHRELALGVLLDEGDSLERYASTPVADLPDLASTDWMRLQVRRLMANVGVIDPENIEHYIARGGYEGLARALSMEPEAVIQEVLDSGLWGRGGAAFPTGRKWDFLRQARGGPKYLICNADEGDPGSFVNRNLLEGDPQLIIEGMVIAAWATGASYGYIYIRDEYPLANERMNRALEQARAKGLLGNDILGSGFAYDMEVVRGAGSYVCGEETGLIASIEDVRGMPKIRPPYPAQSGVFGKPTNVNNVESYANAPLILRHGAAWYTAVGSERHKGTKMFSLSGQVMRPGVLEVPLGTPMRDVIMVAGGGIPESRSLKAVQPGGPLSGVVPASRVLAEDGLPLEPEPFRELGMFMGSGGLVVLDDSSCVVDLAVYFEWFAEDESCGRCTTCFAGTRRLLEIVRRISRGRGRPEDLQLMRMLADSMRYSNCVHGQAAPTVIMSLLNLFPEEVQEHLERRRCPAKACRGLVRYEVAGDDPNLPAAAEICPTGAIVRDNGGYRIDQGLCIRCHACKELAPQGIQVLDAFA
ncbi:NADP-reducing hydrogenase subunit HndC [bacterium HR25]|jgi:NADH:ubiquinone oxidoreductase subunit F (NADH-binding)/(2Fe-2S) ferredoxin|nr:NADP-reducing hydrogenase subunit HndC [bacterium HR25]